MKFLQITKCMRQSLTGYPSAVHDSTLIESTSFLGLLYRLSRCRTRFRTNVSLLQSKGHVQTLNILYRFNVQPPKTLVNSNFILTVIDNMSIPFRTGIDKCPVRRASFPIFYNAHVKLQPPHVPLVHIFRPTLILTS